MSGDTKNDGLGLSDFGFSGTAAKAHQAAKKRGNAGASDLAGPAAFFGSISDLALDESGGLPSIAPAPVAAPKARAATARGADLDLDGIPSGFFDVPNDEAIAANRAARTTADPFFLDSRPGAAGERTSDLSADDDALGDQRFRGHVPSESEPGLDLVDIPSGFFDTTESERGGLELPEDGPEPPEFHVGCQGEEDNDEDMFDDLDVPSVLGVAPDESVLRVDPSAGVEAAHARQTAAEAVRMPSVQVQVSRPQADTGFSRPVDRTPIRPDPAGTTEPPVPTRSPARERRPSGSHATAAGAATRRRVEPLPSAGPMVAPALPKPVSPLGAPAMLYDGRSANAPSPTRSAPPGGGTPLLPPDRRPALTLPADDTDGFAVTAAPAAAQNARHGNPVTDPAPAEDEDPAAQTLPAIARPFLGPAPTRDPKLPRFRRVAPPTQS